MKIFSLVKRHGKSLKLTYVTSIVFKKHHIRFQLNGTSSVRKLFSRQKLICRMFLVAESLFWKWSDIEETQILMAFEAFLLAASKLDFQFSLTANWFNLFLLPSRIFNFQTQQRRLSLIFFLARQIAYWQTIFLKTKPSSYIERKRLKKR